MPEKGTVLVPLDGSQLSERSLPYATALAKALGSRLVLMVAAYTADIPEHGRWSAEMSTRPREICTAYLESVRARVAPAAELIVKFGYPYEEILRAADEAGASLIVVSTHGRSGFTRFMYGSTTGHLLHASHVPLLVIGKNVPDPGAAYSPKHLLLPLDGSKLAEAALPHASELAAVFDAKVSLLRVAPYSAEAFPMMVPQVSWPNLDNELVASAKSYLDGVKATIDRQVDVHVMQGPRTEGIFAFSEKHAVDLIVMATHGRAGVQRAILGSTADRMLDGHAPVLLVRPQSC
jgi:nucleotide-binding universal stress UspA family protein